MNIVDVIGKIYNDALDIVKKKNHDYASTEDPFKNFRNSEMVGVRVERGILVRILDKISRISNLIDRDAKVKDESIEDTLIDVINYSALLLAYRRMYSKEKEREFAIGDIVREVRGDFLGEIVEIKEVPVSTKEGFVVKVCVVSNGGRRKTFNKEDIRFADII